MGYASLEQIKQYLDQLAGTTASDAVLQAALDRASTYIDTQVGYTFGTAAPGIRTITGSGTAYLTLPDNGSTVTLVTVPAGYTVPAYVERDGVLMASTNGVLYPSYFRILSPFTSPFLWVEGVPYTVSATYGYGAAPLDIVECCLQIAIRLWRFRESGGSEVIGAEGAAIEVRNGESAFVKATLDRYALDTANAGVW